jgi:predicted N-acetyltransferase YhbS
MPDMLVKLYSLPPVAPEIERQRAAGVIIRRARPYEIARVAKFISARFSSTWADEVSVGYARQPVSVLIAIADGEVVGFAGYECTARGFFGPTGVDERFRNRGIGRALLLAALHGLHELGYAYGFIGAAGPTDFYARTVDATPIEGSTPGIYGDGLKKTSDSSSSHHN